MPKTDLSFNPDDYALVADRIALFYERYPTGRIIPRLHRISENSVIFEALVYRDQSDGRPAAIGWAREFEDDGYINQVACLENTETSAIGRALANLGFSASRKRPSYEEMAKADRARRRLAARSQSPSLGHRPLSPAQDRLSGTALETKAAAVMDVIRLIRAAARLGLPPDRAESLVARVAEGRASDASLARLERALRGWLAAHARGRFDSRS